MARPAKPARTTKPAIDDKAIVDEADLGKGGDDHDEDDEHDDDDEDDEKKSDVEVADLRKAMDDLEDAGKQVAAGVSPRAAALTKKITDGGKLTKAEADELLALTSEEEPVTTKAEMRKSDDIRGPLDASTDASDFLDALLTKVASSIDGLKGEIKKSDAGSNSFNAQLAKGFATLGRAVADLTEKVIDQAGSIDLLKSELGIVVEQPRAPKGSTRPAARPGMNKGGDDNHDDLQLSESVISDTLDEMLQKGEFPLGVEGLVEISKYESTRVMRPDVMEKVLAKHGKKLPDAA